MRGWERAHQRRVGEQRAGLGGAKTPVGLSDAKGGEFGKLQLSDR